jgi:hypothetical protein
MLIKIFKTSLLILILLTFSCNNDDDINSSALLNPIDVYVTGSIDGNAIYYKNSEQITLDNGGFSNSNATRIFVSDNNIYVKGTGCDDSQQGSCSNLLWTNGIVTNLNVVFSESGFDVALISDFYVYNDDVYFLGYLSSISNPTELDMVYWKNGIKTIILENATYDGNAPKIIVSNDDVYVYLKNANGDYEIFINNVFYAISQNYGAVRMAVNESDVYIYGSILSSSNGFYYNIDTGIETITPYFVHRLVFDQDDIYTLVLYSGSFFEEILKNNNLYFQTPDEFIVDDFVVHNGILYSIERNLANEGPQIVLANNIPLLTLANPTSYAESFLGSIYVVEN